MVDPFNPELKNVNDIERNLFKDRALLYNPPNYTKKKLESLRPARTERVEIHEKEPFCILHFTITIFGKGPSATRFLKQIPCVWLNKTRCLCLCLRWHAPFDLFSRAVPFFECKIMLRTVFEMERGGSKYAVIADFLYESSGQSPNGRTGLDGVLVSPEGCQVLTQVIVLKRTGFCKMVSEKNEIRALCAR